jgi:hypothetical protein
MRPGKPEMERLTRRWSEQPPRLAVTTVWVVRRSVASFWRGGRAAVAQLPRYAANQV